MTLVTDLAFHITNDNQNALNIYDELNSSYQSSLKIYPKKINLLGIYFIDILKLLTQIQLKNKEISLGILPNGEALGSLRSWPYFGYEDLILKRKPLIENYGKNISINQHFFVKVFNKFELNIKTAWKKNLPIIGATKFVVANKQSSIFSPSLKLKLISLSDNWFEVPVLEEQLKIVGEVTKDIIAKAMININAELVSRIITDHIRANCREGDEIPPRFGEFLLLQSGVELKNRMLASVACRQGIPVINTIHGEGYGIYDEPLFSLIGEQMYSSLLLGYGPEAVRKKSSFKYGFKKNLIYLESDAEQVKKYFEPEYKGIYKSWDQISFFYYPTTLSGSSHRYGPFRDTSDYFYMRWQKALLELFGSQLKVKTHPKEKYPSSIELPAEQQATGGFEKLIPEIDVFIFDYIGTAFNIACATSKPVIYFDLGIRQISTHALDEIKKRTLYFDIKDKLPTKDDISQQLSFAPKQNFLTKKYSLSSQGVNRLEALERGLNNFF